MTAGRYTPWKPLARWHWRRLRGQRWWRRDMHPLVGTVEFKTDREMAVGALQDYAGYDLEGRN